MTEYGIIEGGYLRIREIEPRTDRRQNADGTITEVTLSVEEQLAYLPGWKPVDRIDENSMQSDDPDSIVVPVPYDAGDHIAYRYETKFDTQKVRREIRSLKDELSGSDYKVIKCYEAAMTGWEMPYDVAAIHAERQTVRNRINELEQIAAEKGEFE